MHFVFKKISYKKNICTYTRVWRNWDISKPGSTVKLIDKKNYLSLFFLRTEASAFKYCLKSVSGNSAKVLK